LQANIGIARLWLLSSEWILPKRLHCRKAA
jgi:hypothetical protein